MENTYNCPHRLSRNCLDWEQGMDGASKSRSQSMEGHKGREFFSNRVSLISLFSPL
jgi:hypothetical protein